MHDANRLSTETKGNYVWVTMVFIRSMRLLRWYSNSSERSNDERTL